VTPVPNAATGRRVIVTGAARGIGRAVYDCFAAAGDDVAGIDIREDVLEMGRPAWPGRQFGVVADLADSAQVRSAVQRAVGLLSGVDVLVNVAGGAQRREPLPEQDREPSAVASEAELDATWSVNVKAAFLAAELAAADMMPRRVGSIITVGSGFGERSLPGRVPYTIVKAAVTGLTRSLAVEWGPYNIRVNEIVPYAVTDATRSRLEDPDVGPSMVARIPLGYLAEPSEIAPAVLFLASDDARYITGARLHIDGGRCIFL
jgi:NAD(P)-dependent dehydrogenase (short-subunit alcohol dehydrogenase family)